MCTAVHVLVTLALAALADGLREEALAQAREGVRLNHSICERGAEKLVGRKAFHVVRELEITPPLPSFNIAITEAIDRWEFEPLLVNRIAVPVCMTVTVNINWS